MRVLVVTLALLHSACVIQTITTPFAVIVDTARASEISGGTPTQIAFTVGLSAVIAAFSGSVLPTLFASDSDVYVRR